MTLTEFLLARIAEDEADAQDDIRNQYGVFSAPHLLGCELNTYDPQPCDCGYPARVLAECEAKRRIVETLQAYQHEDDYESDAGFIAYREVCRDLTRPYASHPDYNEDW